MKIDSETHDYVMEDLDETTLLVSPKRLAALKARLEQVCGYDLFWLKGIIVLGGDLRRVSMGIEWRRPADNASRNLRLRAGRMRCWRVIVARGDGLQDILCSGSYWEGLGLEHMDVLMCMGGVLWRDFPSWYRNQRVYVRVLLDYGLHE